MSDNHTGERNSKKIEASRVLISQIMLPDQANFRGTVHGGEIMKLMDSTAYVVAKKHCGCNVSIVTARVDELEFHSPIHIEDIVKITGELVYVGRSSMEIFLKVEVDHLAQSCCGTEHEVALTAYFTMVALDSNNHPITVPGLILTTKEEEERYELGKERYEYYKNKRKKSIDI